MSHLDEGRLQELLDGEIPSAELPPIQAHLASCAECRARLDEARGIGAEADRLIETIDLADAPARVVPRVVTARPRAWIRNLAWAATVVIAAGLGYSARTTGVPNLTRPAVNDESVAAADKKAVNGPVLPAPPAEPETAAAQAPPPRTPAPTRRTATRAAANQPTLEGARNLTAGSVANAAKLELETAAAKETRQTAAAGEPESVQKKPKSPVVARLRLDETKVAGAAEGGKALVAPASVAPTPLERRPVDSLTTKDQPRLDTRSNDAFLNLMRGAPAPVEVTFSEALRRLNGSIRLIEGLVPVRLEVLGPDVRVVYPLAAGELVLAERLENGTLTYRLLAPAGFPADSLERLRARVRD
ncbi:MAG TPA: zf-HC2 domain-containing protein [Gemmatimonadales bacterium]|nr:zf-HC2 domain-containing protein [Gemmatimonadales bacterium]